MVQSSQRYLHYYTDFLVASLFERVLSGWRSDYLCWTLKRRRNTRKPFPSQRNWNCLQDVVQSWGRISG